MSFVFIDLSFLIVFSLVLIIFLFYNRDKIKREGIVILYRTQLGVKAINYLSKKYKKFINNFEGIQIAFGYLLMIGGILLFVQLVYMLLKYPFLVKALKIPPVAPLIPYLPQIFKADYLPPFYFTYWIIVLGITAIVHEFFHGIFAKAREIKIKSTGFAFIGPFFGAFVEPDEAKIKKLDKKPQIAFLSAGSFSNLLLAILFFFVMWIFFISAYAPAGAMFNSYAVSVANTSNINLGNETLWINFNGGLNLTSVYVSNTKYYLDSQDLNKLKNNTLVLVYDDSPALKTGLIGVIIEFDGSKIRTNHELARALLEKKPLDNIIIKTLYNNSVKEFSIILGSRPDDSSKAYLGIGIIKQTSGLMGKLRDKIIFYKNPFTYYKPRAAEDLTIFLYNLIWWIILINLSVALFNMLPLGITDGGRVFYLTILGLTGSEKIAKRLFSLSTYLILLVFLAITFLWIFSFI